MSKILQEELIKLTKCHPTAVRMASIKNTSDNKCWVSLLRKEKDLCTIGENVNWCGHYRKQRGVSSKKIKIQLTYEPAIFLLAIYPEEMKLLPPKDICTSVFTVGFMTVKIWKQSYCFLMDEWIKWDVKQPTIIQPLERRKYGYLQLHGWTWGIMLNEINQTKINTL